MKKRIVLEKHELYKLLDCLPMQMVIDEDIKKERTILLFGKERKVEQVPETYEELRSLCIDVSTTGNIVYIFNDWGTNNEYLMTHSLKFYPNGTICVHGDNDFVVCRNRTPAQMWQIIKGLMGE